jgi:hypothetical protein
LPSLGRTDAPHLSKLAPLIIAKTFRVLEECDETSVSLDGMRAKLREDVVYE